MRNQLPAQRDGLRKSGRNVLRSGEVVRAAAVDEEQSTVPRIALEIVDAWRMDDADLAVREVLCQLCGRDGFDHVRGVCFDHLVCTGEVAEF